MAVLDGDCRAVDVDTGVAVLKAGVASATGGDVTGAGVASIDGNIVGDASGTGASDGVASETTGDGANVVGGAGVDAPTGTHDARNTKPSAAAPQRTSIGIGCICRLPMD